MADIETTTRALQNQNERLKRKRNLSADATAKLNKNSGNAYMGRNGIQHNEKLYDEMPCGNRCRKPGCVITEERILELFQQYWDTGCYNEQSSILARFMRKEFVANAEDQENISRRLATYKYYIPDTDGIQYQVCKTTFQSVFGVTAKRIQILQNKISANSLSLSDGRGRHLNRPKKLQNGVKEAIILHINSYEKSCSHYSRNEGNPVRGYLGKDLNISIMFRDFAVGYGEEALSWKWVYRILFRESRLKFGKPKSDTCTKCDRYHNKISSLNENVEEERQILEPLWLEFVEHQIDSDYSYAEFKKDNEQSNNDASYIVLSVDLQGILLCPRLSNSEYYYQRKYPCFNLGIHQGNNNRTTMAFWHKTEANRGSSEIASSIYKYCLENFHPLQEGEVRTLVVYSDRCVGQNNNFMILSMYRLLLAKRLFTQINQKFMSTGHSFLPPDRQFSLIEKKQKNAMIFTPMDWIKIIEESNLQNPFIIQRMTQEQFFDFVLLSRQLRRPATLRVTESRWFQMSIENPAEILTKDLLSDQNWKSHQLVVPQDFGNTVLSRLYEDPIPLPAALIKDLKSMQDFIPQESRAFWNFLNVQN